VDREGEAASGLHVYLSKCAQGHAILSISVTYICFICIQEPPAAMALQIMQVLYEY